MLIPRGATIIPASGGGIVDAVRYATVQTLTNAEKARACANIGFADVFTVATLPTDPTIAKAFAIAYCSDCYTSVETQIGTRSGGMVRWSDSLNRWVTMADSIPATDDFAVFAANMVIFGRQQNVIAPVCQTVGLGLSTASVVQNVSGGTINQTATQANTSFGQSSGSVIRLQTGATSGQYASALLHAGTTFGATGRRRFAMVMSFIQCQSITADDYTWQLGIRTRNSIGLSTPANLWSIGFDPANRTGCNPGTSNLAVLTRTNSTAVAASGSRILNGAGYTVTNTTPAWLVVVMEPINTTSARMRAIVLPQGNTPSTSAIAVVDETWTPSVTDFEIGLFGQKTNGSTTSFEAYARSIGLVSWADNDLPSTVEHDPIFAINPIA